MILASFISRKTIRLQILQFLLILLFLIPVYLVIYKLYIPHINSFGCFDECMNYLGGYFMLQGRSLYSQIFFNHQPSMAYLSALVQVMYHTQNIPDFLLRHTQFLIFFSFLFNLLLIKRFRFAAAGFVLFFELTKYFLFGHKFLGESFIIYPMVYMIGLVWYKITKQKIYPIEYLLSTLFTWFVLYTREPYVIAAMCEFIFIVGVPISKIKKSSYILLLFLSIVPLFFLPLKEYLFQVFTVSFTGTGTGEVKNIFSFQNFLTVFLYPLFVFWGGLWNEFRFVLIGLSVSFCLLAGYILFFQKRKMFLFIVCILGLANLRIIQPGLIFYGAFHLIPWMGMFVFMTFLMLQTIYKSNRYLAYLCFAISLSTLSGYMVFSKAFIHFPVNQQADFLINNGMAYDVGKAVHMLSTPSQTFFIDHVDPVDLAYIQAKRTSPYTYAWNGYFAPNFSQFVNAREDMFKHNPPDFYYGLLPKELYATKQTSLDASHSYQVLFQDGKPSLLFVKKSVYDSIPDTKWKEEKQFGFEKSDKGSSTGR